MRGAADAGEFEVGGADGGFQGAVISRPPSTSPLASPAMRKIFLVIGNFDDVGQGGDGIRPVAVVEDPRRWQAGFVDRGSRSASAKIRPG